MLPKYEFPNFPNAETRQSVNPLRIADGRNASYAPPSNVAMQNNTPNPYVPEAAYQVPGTQVFGTGKGYFTMPQNQDILHREIALHIDEPLLYRGNLGTPRRESATSRVFAPSITKPVNNAATFIGSGKIGDVYGN